MGRIGESGLTGEHVARLGFRCLGGFAGSAGSDGNQAEDAADQNLRSEKTEHDTSLGRNGAGTDFTGVTDSTGVADRL